MHFRNRIHLFTFILLVLTWQPLMAQETGTQIGIGISFEPVRLYEFGSTTISYTTIPVSIYVPINIRSRFRLEPELGVFAFKNELTNEYRTLTTTISSIRVGIGAFYLLTPSSDLSLYVGPRVGVCFVSSEISEQSTTIASTDKMTERDFSYGLGLGAEYFPASQVSFGGEAQFNYTNFGNPSRPSISHALPARTRNVYATNGLIFIRFYF